MLRRKTLDDHLSCCRTKQKGLVQVKPENLRWTPFVPSPHVQVSVGHTVTSCYIFYIVKLFETLYVLSSISVIFSRTFMQ